MKLLNDGNLNIYRYGYPASCLISLLSSYDGMVSLYGDHLWSSGSDKLTSVNADDGFRQCTSRGMRLAGDNSPDILKKSYALEENCDMYNYLRYFFVYCRSDN